MRAIENVRNYTGHGWQGGNYDRNLDIKDVAKIIRKQQGKVSQL